MPTKLLVLGIDAASPALLRRWAAEGKIKPHICATYPLENTLDALRLMQQRRVIGKVSVSTNRNS